LAGKKEKKKSVKYFFYHKSSLKFMPNHKL